jgi:hypothetical protein
LDAVHAQHRDVSLMQVGQARGGQAGLVLSRVGPFGGDAREVARQIDPSARLTPQPSKVPQGAVMTRTVAGADAIIALRCREASSQWEAICKQPRTQTGTAGTAQRRKRS